jgi:Arc/MetJ-type ribon-helix-helix transcriptional regulator
MGANNISLPEPLLAEIQSAAQAENRSVDEVLQEALRQYLDDRSWTKILGYGQRRAKELGLTEADNIEVRGPLVKSLQYQLHWNNDVLRLYSGVVFFPARQLSM